MQPIFNIMASPGEHALIRMKLILIIHDNINKMMYVILTVTCHPNVQAMPFICVFLLAEVLRNISLCK